MQTRFNTFLLDAGPEALPGLAGVSTSYRFFLSWHRSQ